MRSKLNALPTQTPTITNANKLSNLAIQKTTTVFTNNNCNELIKRKPSTTLTLLDDSINNKLTPNIVLNQSHKKKKIIKCVAPINDDELKYLNKDILFNNQKVSDRDKLNRYVLNKYIFLVF